jgi:hypothetical protein
MNWQTILDIHAWTPLREVAPRGEMVLPGVCRIGESAFLVTQPYNRAFEQNLPEAPFVTLAVWAESVSALRRCLNCDATTQVQSIITRPPDILLLGTQGKYGELSQHIPQTKRKIAERAVYSSTGAFVHKIIEIDRFCFCFLDQRIKRDEGVYAIEVTLQ